MSRLPLSDKLEEPRPAGGGAGTPGVSALWTARHSACRWTNCMAVCQGHSQS